MKFLTAIATAAVLGLSMSAPAQASGGVYFKAPVGFAGTGCPAGSIPPPSGVGTDTLSILFTEYDAGKDSYSGQSRRASCNFAVPVHVPQGYQVSTMTADWQGYAEGQGQLKRKYFFAGQPNVPWLTSHFNSPHGTDFLRTDNLAHSTLTWSACGRDVNLRINSNIRTSGRHSMMAVDTLDLQNKVVFKVQWRRCR